MSHFQAYLVNEKCFVLLSAISEFNLHLPLLVTFKCNELFIPCQTEYGFQALLDTAPAATQLRYQSKLGYLKVFSLKLKTVFYPEAFDWNHYCVQSFKLSHSLSFKAACQIYALMSDEDLW